MPLSTLPKVLPAANCNITFPLALVVALVILVQVIWLAISPLIFAVVIVAATRVVPSKPVNGISTVVLEPTLPSVSHGIVSL